MSRRFQFSLRWLLVVTLVAATLAALLHYGKIGEAIALSAELKALKRQQALQTDHDDKPVWCGPVCYSREIDARIAAAESQLKLLKCAGAMPRFTTSLWLMACLACFLGGLAIPRRRLRPGHGCST